MDNVKKPSRDYYGLKRLIEIGSIASPLVVVFAVFLAPLFAESVASLIGYSNNLNSSGSASLVFGITGLVVVVVASIYAGFQAHYYFTRTRKGRHFLYWLGGALLAVIVIVIVINAATMYSEGITYEALRYFTTLLQSFIAISIFTIFNIAFMYAWTLHLKNAQVERQPDELINVIIEE